MSMTNQETDTALILENELKRRVREVATSIIQDEVRRHMEQEFTRRKEHMLMEVSIKVGQMLKGIEEEGRQPLWVTGPETMKEFNHAIRE